MQIGLFLLALFLLVRMTQYNGMTDKLSGVASNVSGVASGVASDISGVAAGLKNTILVHPNDPLGQPTSQQLMQHPTSADSAMPIQQVQGGGTAGLKSSLLGSAREGLCVQPVDYNAIFNPKEIQPTDLIPKVDPELYPGGAFPGGDLNQNFITNEIQAGLPTSNRRKYINDLREIHTVPITSVSPWGNPTSFPDVSRKSLCDL